MLRPLDGASAAAVARPSTERPARPTASAPTRQGRLTAIMAKTTIRKPARRSTAPRRAAAPEVGSAGAAPAPNGTTREQPVRPVDAPPAQSVTAERPAGEAPQPRGRRKR